MTRWLVPAGWLVLPVSAGPAAAAGLHDWSVAPRSTASVGLWAAWAVVLLATLAPRPVGLTALRLGAPLSLAVAALTAPSARPLEAAAALVTAGLVTAMAAAPATAELFSNGTAYGDERRFPLRVPLGLGLLVVPAAIAVVGLGAAAGPLLLADGRLVPGALAVAAGVPAMLLLVRSFHALWRRWIVLVPGGVVVHDPLTLLDPVLFPRDRVAGLLPLGAEELPEPVVDVRLGARGEALVIVASEETPMAVVGRNRRTATMVPARAVVFAPARPERFLAGASARRLPVQRRRPAPPSRSGGGTAPM